MALARDMTALEVRKRSARPNAPRADQAQELDRVITGMRILILGGTGSLGQELLTHLHRHNDIAVFSRDEEKQWKIKNRYSSDRVTCILGDIRDYDSVHATLRSYRPDMIINAAALKQITACEYHPLQSIKTNILGVQHLVDAVNHVGGVQTVVGISTDKACQPVNVYGMSKAIQERIYVEANLHSTKTRFICVRYGNVLESRGSVIPLFKEQITKGGPVTVTLHHMTRFLLSLQESVKLIFTAVAFGLPGDIWIPKVCSATVGDLADTLIDGRDVAVKVIGIRPGEKIHETLVSEEEVFRTVEHQGHFVIEPTLPELRRAPGRQRDGGASPVQFQRYTSKEFVLSKEAVRAYLKQHGVI